MSVSGAVRHPPGRAEIIRAIPGGSRRLVSRDAERIYLEQLGADPRLLAMRAHGRASVLAVARVLSRCASWTTGVTWPTRARICRLASICTSTWKAVRRRLEDWGYLGLVSPGQAAWLRPAVLHDHHQEGNDAAVYVICLPKKAPRPAAAPASPVTRPPTRSRSDRVLLPARAREAKPRKDAAPRRLTPGPSPAGGLRKGPGQTISEAYREQLARPFAAAGWTAADLAFAVDHRPAGRQWRLSVANVTQPGAWIRWRLSWWLTPAGPGVPWRHRVPRPSRTHMLAAAAAAQRDRAARRLAEAAMRRAQAALVDVPARAREARQAMIEGMRRRGQ